MFIIILYIIIIIMLEVHVEVHKHSALACTFMYMVNFKTVKFYIFCSCTFIMYESDLYIIYCTTILLLPFFQEIKKKEAEFAETIPPHLKIFEK